jgi:hypothetical protein
MKPSSPFTRWLSHTPQAAKHFAALVLLAFFLIGTGVFMGWWVTSATQTCTQETLEQLQRTIFEQKHTLEQLTLNQTPSSQSAPALTEEQRARIQREGRRYVATLQKVGALSAAHLNEWFIQRWIALLDHPQPEDRIKRRASLLSLLIGGMSAHINPGDYVSWQTEFLSQKWLAEVRYDSDGDGLPRSRFSPNTHDAFADTSICHIAMALNQVALDLQILVMPELHCDRPDARISVFLQGSTFDDGVSEFIRTLKEQGFPVVEKQERGTRLVLVGAKKHPPQH